MSLETLETIKKHISDTLGVELVPAQDGRDGEAFNAKIDGQIIVIFIPIPLIQLLEESGDIDECLENLDVLSFIRDNPGCNASVSFSGVVVDPTDS